MRLICTLAFLSLFLATGCASKREAQQKDLYANELKAQVTDLKGQVRAKDARIAELEARPVQVIENDPSADMRRDLAGSGADVEWRNGELVISIASDILFSPGSDTLTSKAKESLKQVVSAVRKRYRDNFVRVEGHTDSDPIRRSKDRWADNWHLAGGRARAVLHELSRLGIPEDQLSFAGYADKRPRESNDSKSGKAKNRRVEIVVLPTQQP